MVAPHLPDEIIREILSPVLKVPDETFDDTSHNSPFFRYSESTSALLVVCKSWLRVSTPLLYNVVVLRSKAQAQALERALQKNGLLGTFIRKLRLEGGFGSATYQIITRAPKITDLCLTTGIWTADSVSGLCRGLPSLDPRYLVLREVKEIKDNAPTRLLRATLVKCFQTWKNLETLKLPWNCINIRYSMHDERVNEIIRALKTAKCLKTITIRHPVYEADFFDTLKGIPSLQRIRVVLQPSNYQKGDDYTMNQSRYYESRLQQDDPLKKLLDFEYPAAEIEDEIPIYSLVPQSYHLPSFDPSFVAFKSTPESDKERIFSRIVYYSLLINEDDVPEDMKRKCALREHLDLDVEHTNKVMLANILLVCKVFQRLALQHFYQYCVLESPTEVIRLAKSIERDPSFAARIYSIAFNAADYWIRSGLASALSTIIQYTSGLRMLYGLPKSTPGLSEPQIQPSIYISYQDLHNLANGAGRSLVRFTGISVAPASTATSPQLFYKFASLRSLDWIGEFVFPFRPSVVPPDALGCLENLRVLDPFYHFGSVNEPSSFLELLICMNLAALRHVSFIGTPDETRKTRFLERHGGKLETLEVPDGGAAFSLCPSLTTMTIYSRPTFEAHATLIKIVVSETFPLNNRIKQRYGYLGQVNFRELYPALEELQVYMCEWPTTEHDIRSGPKSYWFKWSEQLAKWQIKLTDREGRAWRSRIK